jgi:hypothetical protein
MSFAEPLRALDGWGQIAAVPKGNPDGSSQECLRRRPCRAAHRNGGDRGRDGRRSVVLGRTVIPLRTGPSSGSSSNVAEWRRLSAQRWIGTVGRLTNPDRFSRWVLRRLSQLPDVAEFTRG